jgi:UDP:flavonoid glycosyltransferase YjiC (YdhE family)
VLHHGGVGLAALCLSAGLPQVILSKQLDNRTAGSFVAAEGLGAHARLDAAGTDWIAWETRRARDDADLRARCRARAPEFDGWFGPDPTLAVAETAHRLIGSARR